MQRALAEVINAHRAPGCEWEVVFDGPNERWTLLHKDGTRSILWIEEMVQLAEVTIQAATVRAIRENSHEDQ